MEFMASNLHTTGQLLHYMVERLDADYNCNRGFQILNGMTENQKQKWEKKGEIRDVVVFDVSWRAMLKVMISGYMCCREKRWAQCGQ